MGRTLTHSGPGTMAANDPRWAAVLARDHRADGTFYYSVRTTGVYCRPSCASRPARPANVAFHDTRAEAEAAGFRPCRRCRPDLPPIEVRYGEVVARCCRVIDAADRTLTLDELAAPTGLSPYHFHRVFKAVTGLTPRAYARMQRSSRVRDALVRSRTVTEAIYEAGFNSSGRFYTGSAETLGMTPREFRGGGERTEIHFAVAVCSLGRVLVARSARGLCAILLGDDADALVRELEGRFPRAVLTGGDPAFEATVAQVVELVDDPRRPFDLPLDLRGTIFQQRVWQALRDIPPGTTVSYSELAARLGVPQATRAVARACASNAIAVAVPCHRVVRHDGGLSGYRWGVDRKRRLLEKERQ